MLRISATGNEKGFTLLEILLVVLIMGLLTATVSLALPDSADQQLRRDVKILQAKLSLAMEQAVYRNRDYGLLIQPTTYAFYQLEQGQWLALNDDPHLATKPLSEATTLSLSIEGQAIIADDSQAPQIYLLSDGQVSEFEIILTQEGVPLQLSLSASYGGELRLTQEQTP